MDKQKIIDFIQQIGKAISRHEWGQYPNVPCSKSTVSLTFGNWRAAMKAAGFEPIRKPNKPIKACLICGKPTKRTYCSRACGLKDTARFISYWKHKCIDCNTPITKHKYYCKRCPTCQTQYLITKKSRTKDEIIHAGKTARYGRIAEQARKKYFSPELACVNCGYSNYIEVCHIKPVHTFSKTTLVSEINAPENITFLCPNCHWELDHGLLTLKQVKYDHTKDSKNVDH